MTTNSLQFDDYYRGNKLYGGTYSKDLLIDKKPAGKFWIINLEDFDAGNGSHWVCMIDFLDQPLYVDPFGISPPNDIISFMGRSKKRKPGIYSKAQYQEVDSTNCGLFCLEFIDELLEHGNLERMDEDLTDRPSDHNEDEVEKVKLR